MPPLLHADGGQYLIKALNTIVHNQSTQTELTNKWVEQVLDYVMPHQNTKIKHHASDMQLLVHRDSSYLNDHNTRSSYGGYFFLRWYQPENAPLRLNGCLLVAVDY